MRLIAAAILVLASFVALPALADVYSVTATMPTVSGAAQCKLYVNAAAAAGGVKACGTAVTYTALIPTESTYAFTYSGVTAAGIEGARSPATTVAIALPPTTPGAGPSITITCPPGSPAQITVNGVAVPCG